MPRVPFATLEAAFVQALLPLGLSPERAALCGRLFAETTRDGVYTHGLTRFPRFAEMIRLGEVKPAAEPVRRGGFGAIERWDGQRGPGNLNAWAAMQRATELAAEHGIGAVALAETNHWMRGGTYGWQAADRGCFAACFTNTLPNLPAWGSADPVLGNNPLVLAVPRANGAHVVLDMAMSQYSYGALDKYASRGEQLPFPGGFDSDGNLTTDAAAIRKSWRALPIGLWKGSGLALMLDMFAALLSGGLATHDLPRDPLREAGISQFFLAIDPRTFADAAALEQAADRILADLTAARPLEAGKPVRYPGEQTLQVRAENLRLGVPVDEVLWEKLLARTI